MDDFNGIISKYLDKTKKILNEKYVTIRSIKKNKKLYEFPAVYIIYSPKNKLLYIGKSGNFYSRIYRHVHSNGDSCLNVMIDYFSFSYKNPEQYKVKYLQINNSRVRGFFENFLISILKPKYNKVHN